MKIHHGKMCRADDGWVALSRILTRTQVLGAGEGGEGRTS
jgi:hypothetical protein